MRMSNIVLLLLMTFVFGVHAYADGLDTLKRQALSHKLDEYFEALKHEPLPVQQQECDFLIESTSDSLVRQFVAQTIFDHFTSSKVMGAENVAVHVFDRWFLDGKVRMADQKEFIAARFFADINRSSLLGCDAPALAMEDIEGGYVSLFGEQDKNGPFRILYFYDTSCSKCRVESILLRNLLSVKGYPVELYAIYAGDDRQSWTAYVNESFAMDKDSVRVVHIWDPLNNSEFQRLYGVVQTPRMFLISPDGTIIGRGLDTKALEQLLDGIFAESDELTYGGDEAMRMFSGIFGMEAVKKDDVCGVSDYISRQTLEKGDTLMFRQLAGDFLYYLAVQSSEPFKEGMDYHIDKYILSRGNVWKSADDSLKVIGFAEMMDDLLSKSRPGSRLSSLKVKSERLSYKGTSSGKFNLRNIGADRNFILFYTEGCEICAAEKEAARKIVAGDRNTRVLLVNVDSIMKMNPELAATLMNNFDLSSLPYIIETDSKGYVKKRYLSLQTLANED